MRRWPTIPVSPLWAGTLFVLHQQRPPSCTGCKTLWGGARGTSWERVHTQLAWEGAIPQELGGCLLGQ